MKSKIEQLHFFYKLKEVNRANSIGKEDSLRNESTAEHVYSMLILAEFFLPQHPELDADKVRKLILYHDICEVYAGDSFVLDSKKREDQDKREEEAYERILLEINISLHNDIKETLIEMQENTKENQFMRAIDGLDPIIQGLEYPSEWQKYGFTEEVLRKIKQKEMEKFPILKEFFEELVQYVKDNNIIAKD